MIGKTDLLYTTVEKLVRLINLVAFDVTSLSSAYITDDASPTTKFIHIPLTSKVHKDLHSPVRKLIKAELWTKETAGGKIAISDSLIKITIYLKKLRKPAWSPEESDKSLET